MKKTDFDVCLCSSFLFDNKRTNVLALFEKTAKEWREQNVEKKGNIRDYATVNELICLSNLESLNAVFIEDGLP